MCNDLVCVCVCLIRPKQQQQHQQSYFTAALVRVVVYGRRLLLFVLYDNNNTPFGVHLFTSMHDSSLFSPWCMRLCVCTHGYTKWVAKLTMVKDHQQASKQKKTHTHTLAFKCSCSILSFKKPSRTTEPFRLGWLLFRIMCAYMFICHNAHHNDLMTMWLAAR